MERSAFDIAILLLTVGMGTVFAMLTLVALSSRALIHITNRWAPAQNAPSGPAQDQTKTPNEADEAELAVIIAAVSVVTGGRGAIQQIEKVPGTHKD